MADIDDDDELFKFAPFKPSVEEEQYYHDSLLKDLEDEDCNNSFNSHKRPTPQGLAEQLVSGTTKKRRTLSSDDDDDFFSENKDSKLKYKFIA